LDKAKPIITYSHSAIVSNIGYSVSGTSVTIDWITDENSTAFVDYGKTQGVFDLGSGGTSSTDSATHSVILSNLDASTKYYFRLRSADVSGNEAINNNEGDGYEFTTGIATTPACPTPSCGGGSGISIDTNPPTISNVKVADITASSATVSWETN